MLLVFLPFASACLVCLSSFSFSLFFVFGGIGLKLLKWKKVFVFRSLDITTHTQQHALVPHSHSHTRTEALRYKHHATFCASLTAGRDSGKGEAIEGIERMGERGQACQLDFFMGEFSDLCALFLLFSLFGFFFVFLFCFCFACVLSFAFRFHSTFVAVLFFRFN